MIELLRQFLRSWKAKLLLLCIFASLNSAILGGVMAYSLNQQSQQIGDSLSSFTAKQSDAVALLSALLNFNKVLNATISANENQQIRSLAI